MSIDLDGLGEVYQALKQYIPQKDRQDASDNLMSILVDLLGDADLAEFAGIDSSIAGASSGLRPEIRCGFVVISAITASKHPSSLRSQPLRNFLIISPSLVV